ncbi:M6 family metalloprotease domain-containing protein [Jiangella mangrovi]|uniref:M6 family metalloprotease-like protein n=1 Tax=Jiangella mangrovi TaxID=1524084 RepID=A0A7W9GRB9_9ACTN|nr:M6 family metalloprotease-like protein [Jiangella mangrovi]
MRAQLIAVAASALLIPALFPQLAGAQGDGPAAPSAAPPIVPIDPQDWDNQYDLTWDDFVPVPGVDWTDPANVPTKDTWRAALVMVDYPNMDFQISQPEGSTIFGTPIGVGDVPREDVPQFYADLLNTPSDLNHGQTLNSYWMEDSYGQYGVDVDSFGPFRMPRNHFEYGNSPYGNAASCPPSFTCNGNYTRDARALYEANVPADIRSQYDLIFYMGAGLDESTAWQVFGEMMFDSPEDVPDEFGPPAEFDPEGVMTNWMPTRYIPWTSWAAGSFTWASAGGGSGNMSESSGTAGFAHEFTHILGLGDNYNGAFAVPAQRTFTGQWDMMSQGSWNGPTGMHTRWKVPADGGSTVGPHHSIRNKLELDLIDTDDIVDLSRTGLASSGLVVAKVRARAAGVNGDELLGVRVTFDGATPLDRTPSCHPSTGGPECMGQANYRNFTLEVVQQLGVDSYTPGNGVLIYKNKTTGSTCGTATCFSWLIDSNPEDIGMVDFYQPDGTPRMVVTGDPRQVNDATFNAGTHSGTDYEWVDEDNRLHFYVIDVEYDEDGVRTYTVAVRSLDGDGPHQRGVALESGEPSRHTPGKAATCTFPLENTGEAAPVDPAAHPSDVTDRVAADVYRLSVSSAGTGWNAELYNELATSGFGDTVEVPVYVTRTPGAVREATVTLTATSESDPSKTATATCVVDVSSTTVRR